VRCAVPFCSSCSCSCSGFFFFDPAETAAIQIRNWSYSRNEDISRSLLRRQLLLPVSTWRYIYVTVGILIIRIYTRLLTCYYNYMNNFLESLMRVLKKQRLLIQSSPRSLLMLPMNMGSISSSSSLLTITGPFFLLFKILLLFLAIPYLPFVFFFFSGMFHTLNDLLMAHSLKLIIWATLGNHVQ